MFNFFKSITAAKKLQEQYAKLMEESFKLLKSNRQASDKKQAEAEKILKQIDALKTA